MDRKGVRWMWSQKDNDIIRDTNAEIEIVIYSVMGDRDEQQDTFGYLIEDHKCLCVVSDGMGGLDNGRKASECTVKELLGAYVQGGTFSNEEEMIEPVRRADDRIFHERDQNGNSLNAGCTVVGVMIRNYLLNWVSIGDSRAYLFRDGKYVQLTKDQNYKTYLDESLRAGAISEEEYQAGASQQEALINYVGMGMIRDTEFIDSNKESLQLQSGDVVLLMSDGVYKILSDEEMNRIIGNVPDIVNLAQTLEMKMVSKAKTYQMGRDNTTLAVIKVK